MLNPFYFSGYVKPALVKIRFVFIVWARFFKVLFRLSKQLEIINLEYTKRHQFEQSLLVIHYRFRNVLWYHFKGIKRTTEEGTLILNLSNVREMPVVLIVHGFLKKRIFHIDVSPEVRMQTKLFQTEINKLNDLTYTSYPIHLFARHHYPFIPKMLVKCSAVQTKRNNIYLKYPLFTQTNFL